MSNWIWRHYCPNCGGLTVPCWDCSRRIYAASAGDRTVGSQPQQVADDSKKSRQFPTKRQEKRSENDL